MEAAGTLIRKVCKDLVLEKRRKLENKETTGVDILSVAIESGGFSDEDLINQMMTFLAAGHETTSSALTWAIYLLCLHPEVQTRLREEIHNNLESIDSDTPMTPAAIDKLPLLHAVCQETLRFFPSVPLTIREASTNGSTVLGQPIPKGMLIFITPWAVNKSTELWGEDAGEFKPDRWMGPGRANTGGASSNYAFLTFLHGPRSCIGQGFAKAEYACLLAGLVGRFQMELADKNFELKIKGGITARPAHGLPVRMTVCPDW
jgi:cytochrome P450